ncbi:hypothetical protein [Maledivibacter halophilus]|uniref:hypothetical protein n=1 Tax=Maledivibacter halophilus TaxID=36842 RepID=UPI001481E29D|nr:hypothetical protein [Maledivibacter halophilus]
MSCRFLGIKNLDKLETSYVDMHINPHKILLLPNLKGDLLLGWIPIWVMLEGMNKALRC